MSTKTILIVSGGLILIGGITLFILYKRKSALAAAVPNSSTDLSSTISSILSGPATNSTSGAAPAPTTPVVSPEELERQQFCAMPDGDLLNPAISPAGTKLNYMMSHGGVILPPPIFGSTYASGTVTLSRPSVATQLQQFKQKMGCV